MKNRFCNGAKKAIIIGTGDWGSIVKKYIQNNHSFEILKCFGRDFDATKIPKDCTIAFILTPLYSHFELAKICLENKIHIFIEKPTAQNLAQTKILFNLARKHKRKIYTDFIYLCSPSVLKMLKLAKTKNIMKISAHICQYGKFYKNENVAQVLGVHLLSVFAHFFLRINVKHYECDSKNLSAKITLLAQHNDKKIPIEIFISLLEENLRKREIKIFLDSENYILFDPLKTPTLEIFENLNAQNFNFDESNNILNSLHKFVQVLQRDKIYKAHKKLTLKTMRLLDV